MVEEIVKLLSSTKKTISFMESCTGGYLANTITNVEGASNVLKFSAVTYANEFKEKLGVNKKTIETHTVYSLEVAKEMSKEISNIASSSFGVGVTGQLKVKDPNNPTNNDDLVFVSIYDKDKDTYLTESFAVDKDSRKDNKALVALKVFSKLLDYLKQS